jgi:hypothetical protein
MAKKRSIISVILWLSLIVVAVACGQQAPLSVQHVRLPLVNLRDFDLSHDGQRVAYHLPCSQQAGIWIASRDGTQARLIQREPLADNLAPCPTPTLSPTSEPGECEWYTPEPVNQAAIEKWKGYEEYRIPFWSPMDTKLIYVWGLTHPLAVAREAALCTPGPERLCPLGSVIHDLTTGETLALDMIRGISFSPDDQKVALYRLCQWGVVGDCVEVSPDTQTVQLLGDGLGLHVMAWPSRQVVYTDTEALPEYSWAYRGKAFRWSPDGKSLCYPVEKDKIWTDFRPVGKVRIVALAEPEQPTDIAGRRCVWAPDSQRIAYVRYPTSSRYAAPQTDEQYIIHQFELRSYDVATGEDRILFAGENWFGYSTSQFDHLEWSLDGRYLAFDLMPFEGRLPNPDAPSHDDKILTHRRVVILNVETGAYWETGKMPLDDADWMRWSADSRTLLVESSSSDPTHQAYLEIKVPQ